MKTKITAVVLMLIIVFSCIASCGSTPTVTTPLAKNFEATCFPDAQVMVKNAETILITSQDELESYRNSYTFSGANAEVLEKMDSYSSGFFDEKMLIVIHLSEASGSYEITVEKVDFADSKAQVTLKREIPHSCTDDVKIWSIFIEVGAQEIKSVDYTVIEEFIEEK